MVSNSFIFHNHQNQTQVLLWSSGLGKLDHGSDAWLLMSVSQECMRSLVVMSVKDCYYDDSRWYSQGPAAPKTVSSGALTKEVTSYMGTCEDTGEGRGT